jgi:hypothetical protein
VTCTGPLPHERGAFDYLHPTRRGDTPRLSKHRHSQRNSIFIAITRRTSLTKKQRLKKHAGLKNPSKKAHGLNPWA